MLKYELDTWESYSWKTFIRAIERNGDPYQISNWDDQRGDWPLFAREVFARLLTNDDLFEVDEPVPWAEQLHEKASEIPEWISLCELCAGSRFDSGISAVAIVKNLKEEIEKQQEQQQGNDQQPSGPQSNDQQENGHTLREAIKKTYQETSDRKEQMDVLGVSWGNEKADPTKSDDVQKALSIAERLKRDDRMRDIAKLAGRMHTSIRRKRVGRVRGRPADLADITHGDDLHRLLPTEMALMRRRVTRLDLLRRLTEKKAMVYEVKGRDVLERGPLVVCTDISSSMSSDNRDVWAKGVTLALAALARDQRRAFHAMLFNSRIQVDSDGQNMVDVVRYQPSGGTNYVNPINRAMDLIDESPKFRKADIIFITDGECSMDTLRFNAWKKDHGVNLYGIEITNYRDSYGTLKEMADELFSINPLDDNGDEILTRFAEVL